MATHCGAHLAPATKKCPGCGAPVRHVAPGDDLGQAVNDAPEETILALAAGTYTLSAWIKLEQDLSLAGAGRDATRIESADREALLHFEADRFEATGITFARTDTAWGVVVHVVSGEVRFEGCRFTGGQIRYSEGKTFGGDGLWISGSTRATVVDCELTGNRGSGVRVDKRASARLERLRTSWNGYHGVEATDHATVELRDGEHRLNLQNGLYVAGSASGTIERNVFADSGHSGVWIQSDGRLVLAGNRCAGNHAAGIRIAADAAPEVRGNTCERNAHSGISVQERAHPQVVENEARENLLQGITFSGGSSGRAERNRCLANGESGIFVHEQAAPDVVENTLEDNHTNGLRYEDQASGRARGNRASRNRFAQIVVYDQASPDLTDNTPDPTLSRDSATATVPIQAVEKKRGWMTRLIRR